MVILENCANSALSAFEAQRGGAYRVELCENLHEGGTIPALAQIELTRELLTIKLHVLIRPRGGDFLYNRQEVDLMERSIRHCGQAGCNGVVVGMLNADGSVDVNRCVGLVTLAKEYGMSVTFHRAFDRCNDLERGLEQVISMGCDRLLTSGGYPTAIEGADTIKRLIEQAGDRIVIMPGAGITEYNIGSLVRKTGLKEFHGSFTSPVAGGMCFHSTTIDDSRAESGWLMTDAKRVRMAVEAANAP